MTARLTGEQLRKRFYSGEYVRKKYAHQPGYRLQRLLPWIELQPGDAVLDCACGRGLLLQFLPPFIGSYTGLDISAELIEMAKETARNLQREEKALFICGEIVDFCSQHAETYNAVFTLDFSEHIYDDDFLAIYTAIHAALKPGGRLYLHTPNADFLLEIMKRRGIMRQIPEHIGVRNARQYSSLLQAAGFRRIENRFLAHYNILKYLNILSILPFFGRYFQARLFFTCTK